MEAEGKAREALTAIWEKDTMSHTREAFMDMAVPVITTAIREAETAALERAADTLEAERERLVIRKQTATGDTSRVMYDYAETLMAIFRDRIRALKTPDPE